MAEDPLSGGEYDVVSLGLDGPRVSIAAFLFTLPFDYGRAWIWPDWIDWTVGGLCAVGFAAGLAGLRSRRRRGMAKVGAVLNGMVCLFLLALEAIYTWY